MNIDVVRLGELIALARGRGATDLHAGAGDAPTLRVNGRVTTLDVPALRSETLESFLEGVLTPDQSRRWKSTGAVDVARREGIGVPYSLHAYGTMGGLRLAFRFLAAEITALDALALPAIVASFAKRTNGLIVFTGPTGSGKTTALAALIARDTDLGDVIGLIARQSGLNIVADASVKSRRITFRLHNVDTDVALATLAQAYDLQTHRAGNVVFVGDAATMNRRYADGSSADASRTEIFTLTRAKPEDVSTALLAALPVGTIAVADKRTASVIVTAAGNTLARARRLVTALDGPVFGATGNIRSTTVALRNAKPS